MTYNTLGLFITKFQVTADELAQERTQLRCYKDTLLTGNCHKICQIKRQNKQTNKNQTQIRKTSVRKKLSNRLFSC